MQITRRLIEGQMLMEARKRCESPGQRLSLRARLGDSRPGPRSRRGGSGGEAALQLGLLSSTTQSIIQSGCFT